MWVCTAPRSANITAPAAKRSIHSARPFRKRLNVGPCTASGTAGDTSPALRAAQLEEAVLAHAAHLPNPIFPAGARGDEAAAREELNSLIGALEAWSPQASPLASGAARGALLGRWALAYASAGTVVTSSALGSVLRTLSVLPFVGLDRVEQEIGEEDEDGRLTTSNAAEFGLGPLGMFRVVIMGHWEVANAQLARVSFDKFSVKMVNVLGIPLPVPTVEVPVENGRVVDFTTTYLSNRVRVSKGQASRIFLFVKEPA